MFAANRQHPEEQAANEKFAQAMAGSAAGAEGMACVRLAALAQLATPICQKPLLLSLPLGCHHSFYLIFPGTQHLQRFMASRET